MTRIVAHTLRRIKDDPHRIFDAGVVADLAGQLGVVWRDRVLTPAVTIRLFLLQVLHRNVACAALPHLSGLAFTAGAYCLARQRLPVELFTALCTRLTVALRETTAQAVQEMGRTFRGHRVFYVDGTGISMPDMPALARRFGKPPGTAPGLGFPMLHALFLMDAATGLVLQGLIAPGRTHDASQVARTHATLAKGDLLLGDRAFCSFAHLALLLRAGLHGLFRAHQRLSPAAAPTRRRRGTRRRRQARRQLQLLRRLGRDDYLAAYAKPARKPEWMDAADFAALPPVVTVRLLRYRIRRRGCRTRWVSILTTLTDPREYPPASLAELYLRRWQMEGWLRDLKRALGMHTLRTTTPAGVHRELCMFVIAYNLVRLVMLRSAERHGLELERVSFTDALRWLGSPHSGPAIPALLCNPERPGRYQPRRLKRKKDDYPYFTKSRRETMQLILSAALGA